tara:strand:- start:372 stop:839 length:468 start_codon:yes stop_codon:yes gene_type:complete
VANEDLGIKNLIINKELKKHDSLRFFDDKNNEVKLDNLKGNLILINFWATWCAPCKEEMPSLDLLQVNKRLSNLRIFPVNIGDESFSKTSGFFKKLNIKNLELYSGNSVVLAKKLSLRGIPTSVLLNKNGEEFARIVGSINFEDKKFISWLSSYN